MNLLLLSSPRDSLERFILKKIEKITSFRRKTYVENIEANRQKEGDDTSL